MYCKMLKSSLYFLFMADGRFSGKMFFSREAGCELNGKGDISKYLLGIFSHLLGSCQYIGSRSLLHYSAKTCSTSCS